MATALSSAARNIRALLLTLGVVLAGSSCTSSGVSYSMTYPQASPHNRYVGPDLDVTFTFTDRTVQLELVNSQSDIMVNWNQATFMSADGRAVRMEPVGMAPVYTLPAGSRTRVELTLTQWFCATPTLWHRRVAFQTGIVHPQQLLTGSATVKLFLPITRVQADGTMGQEMMEFGFVARPQTTAPAPTGYPVGGIR